MSSPAPRSRPATTPRPSKAVTKNLAIHQAAVTTALAANDCLPVLADVQRRLLEMANGLEKGLADPAMAHVLGGALAVMSLGHVEPTFSFWTTSGEFVFVAILAGWQSVAAVFIASTVLEVVRSFSSAYFPNTWQLALGLFLLFVIRFLPKGIGSLWMRGSTR